MRERARREFVLIRCACGDSLSNFRCCESPVRTRVSLYVRVLRGPVVHGGTGGKERSGAELQNDGETTEELFSWARYRCHQDSGKCLCHMSQGSWQMSRHDMTSPNPNPWQMSRHVAMSPHFILVGVKIPIKFAPSRFLSPSSLRHAIMVAQSSRENRSRTLIFGQK